MLKANLLISSLASLLVLSSCATPGSAPGPGAPEVVDVPGPRLPGIPPEVLDATGEESFVDKAVEFYQTKPAPSSSAKPPAPTAR